MFFTKDKLRGRLDEVALYRYEKTYPIRNFQAAEDMDGEIAARPNNVLYDNELTIGENWSGRDRYVWLKTTITFPDTKTDTRLIGYFDFGNTGDGHNSGFESLLFVNGEPYQGVDQNHREVLFPDSFAGKKVELVFRLWSGLEGGGTPTIQTHQLKEAFIGYLNLVIDDLYFTSKATLKTLDQLEEKIQPMRRSSKRLIALTLQLIGVHQDPNKTLPRWQQPTKSYKPHWKKCRKIFLSKWRLLGIHI